MNKLILASASPRRRQILTQAGIPFEVMPSNIQEDTTGLLTPYDCVKVLSEQKAMAVAEKISAPAVILAADTLVVFKGEIIGKPKDEADAFHILKKLQGQKHAVYTGAALVQKKRGGALSVKNMVDHAAVFMRPVSDAELWAYIETGEPMDKAGAYAIQERGCIFVERIEGNFYTIEGLPVVQVYQALKALQEESDAGN